MKIGDQLPFFKNTSISDQLDFSSFIGKNLVIYFYPKDNTPGCTVQACNLKDNFNILQKNNIEIVGISADSMDSHVKFKSKFNLPFNLISDEEKLVIKFFEVWGPKKFMGRTYDGIHRKSFLFNEKGILIDIIEKPNTKNHSEEILMRYKRQISS